MRVLGIDEAGRGCVLGDLIIAGFLAEDPDDDTIRAAGGKDSKTLSAKRRAEARERLTEFGTADVRHVTPAEIDAGNLNQLEEAVIVDLIKAHRPDKVIIDALGHPKTLPAVQQRLAAAVGFELEWLIQPKADRDFPVVGAASIFAKTTRDAELELHAESHGIIGSGYPSDPKTRAWLVQWARTRKPWPSFVRTRWQTVQDLAQVALL